MTSNLQTVRLTREGGQGGTKPREARRRHEQAAASQNRMILHLPASAGKNWDF